MPKQEETEEDFFELEFLRVYFEKSKNKPCFSNAVIKISVNGKETIKASEGDGPVSAMDNVLREALSEFYEADIDSMRLSNYNVHKIKSRRGAASKVRVLIKSGDKDGDWMTTSVSEDIIEASWQALSDSFRKKLAKNGKK